MSPHYVLLPPGGRTEVWVGFEPKKRGRQTGELVLLMDSGKFQECSNNIVVYNIVVYNIVMYNIVVYNIVVYRVVYIVGYIVVYMQAITHYVHRAQ